MLHKTTDKSMSNDLSRKQAKIIEERNKKLGCFRESMIEDNLFFKPIYKLNASVAYTQEEWVIILMNSIQKV